MSALTRAYERKRYALYDSAASYAGSGLLSPEHDLCELPAFIPSEKPCFSARLYKSGELSGAYFVAGLSSRVKPPERVGPVVTSCFSVKAQAKIRRAVENTTSELVTFITLTFSPWDAKPWELSEYKPLLPGVSSRGSVRPGRKGQRFILVPRVSCKRRKVNIVMPLVRQDYAKHRLKNLRSALTMKVNRQISCKLSATLLPLGSPVFVGPPAAPLVGPPVHKFALPFAEHGAYVFKTKFRMIWTAELQKNGNIHFHALTNKYFAFKYLVKLWPYGMSQIKKLKDAEHAAHYMTKYLTNDDKHGDLELISGNRYNISQILRDESKPIIYGLEDGDACEARRALKLMKHIIEVKGGRVIDSGFGFNMPRPRRSRTYKEKETGLIKKTRGVDGRMHAAFLQYWFPCLEACRHSGPVPF